MSEELNNLSNPDTSFEREDLSTRGVFVFMIGLAVTGVVIYFIIVGMYTFLDRYERSRMQASSPLVSEPGATARYIPYAPNNNDYVDRQFKDNGAPMLEHDERGQFKDFLLKQEDQLNSYGWVDEKAGVAHIPIERAMELIKERGLPVRPAGGTETNSGSAPQAAASKKAAGK
jgi:hypothetical protein